MSHHSWRCTNCSSTDKAAFEQSATMGPDVRRHSFALSLKKERSYLYWIASLDLRAGCWMRRQGNKACIALVLSISFYAHVNILHRMANQNATSYRANQDA